MKYILYLHVLRFYFDCRLNKFSRNFLFPFSLQMNYLMNTFLQATLNDSFSLQTILAPLPKDPKDVAQRNTLRILTATFSVSSFIAFGMAFLTSPFIYFLIKERQVRQTSGPRQKWHDTNNKMKKKEKKKKKKKKYKKNNKTSYYKKVFYSPVFSHALQSFM